MSQVLLSPRAYDNELMSELTEQAVLECDVSGLTCAYDNELMSELTEQAVLECDVSGLTIT